MAVKECVPYLSDNIFEERSYLEGKQAGIKEVVDYFFYDAGLVALMGCSTMQECKSRLHNWENKLQEWGI